MSSEFDYDLVVLGAGPGGYVAAIRASQLGMKVCVVEADKPGGVCLNVGCIPSKALIHQAHVFSQIEDLERMGVAVDSSKFDYSKVFSKSREAADLLSRGVQYLLKKNGVELAHGYGRLQGPHIVGVEGSGVLSGNHLLVATGSRPVEIPGFAIDGQTVLSSTDALMLEELPTSMLILGGGAIGVEFAYILNAFGVEVHLVEMLEQILPLEEEQTFKILAGALSKIGIEIAAGTRAVSMQKRGQVVTVTLEGAGGSSADIETEKILLAVGRRPNTEDIGLDKLGIVTDRGFIPVGDFYQTDVPGVFAVGDVIATPLLAHVASKEGEIAVEHMAGHNPAPRMDLLSIPSAVYCEPQLAGFGYTENKAREAGIECTVGTFPYRGVGKAVAADQAQGLIKIISDSDTEEIVGAHIVGAEATELIHELLLARSAELLPEDIAGLTHAHPTLSEGVMEAMRALKGRAIHI